jgi:hypothetical protein
VDVYSENYTKHAFDALNNETAEFLEFNIVMCLELT